MFAAYADFKKAFNSVHREAFCDLRLRWIPAGIIGLLTGLLVTEHAMKCRAGVLGRRGEERVQLLSCEYSNEGRIRSCSITVQHMYGLGNGQTCGSNSLCCLLCITLFPTINLLSLPWRNSKTKPSTSSNDIDL